MKALVAVAVCALLLDATGHGDVDDAGAATSQTGTRPTGVTTTMVGEPDGDAGLPSTTVVGPEQIVSELRAVDLGDADPGRGWMEVADPAVGQTDTSTYPTPSRTLADEPYLDGARLGCAGPGPDVDCSGSQTLDVYKAPGSTPHPVILWVHGGGWVSGDKNNLADPVLRAHQRGFDIVSVNYRLSDGSHPARFPAAVHDTKAAVRWVKANAAIYGFDPDAIVAMGHSAGGHLVQMLATTADVAGLEPTTGLTSAQTGEDSRITAVVSFSAMSDLATFLADGHGWSTGLTEAFLGCAVDCSTATLEHASPTAHVTDDDAPIYAVTGTVDGLAYPHVTDMVGDRYTRAGIGDRLFDDAVDTGPIDCQGHNPWCGTNIVAFDRFLDAANGHTARNTPLMHTTVGVGQEVRYRHALTTAGEEEVSTDPS